MASSSGSANVAPTLLRMNARLDRCFFVKNIAGSLNASSQANRLEMLMQMHPFVPLFLNCFRSHLKRCARGDAGDERREAVLAPDRVVDNRANDRHVVVLEAPAERV